MQLTSLELTDYRSYPQLSLPVGPGITVLVGRNGQGKTNVVEALWYLATLSSHRVAHDAALVHRGASTAIIRAAFVRAGRPLQVDLEITPGRSNRARLQGQNVARLRDLLGEVRAVLFAPEDLGLVKGDPEGRRRFLDELLFVIAPRYAAVKADYDRVLKQRSNLLKQMRSMRRGGSGRSVGGLDPAESAASTLEVWDQQLARHGAELLRARLHLVNRLRPHLGYSYLRVASDEGAESALDLPPSRRGEVTSPADVSYRSAVLDELGTAPGELPTTLQVHDALLALTASRHAEEVDRGTTLPRTATTSRPACTTPPRRATRATASPGPSPSPCAWPATTCCAWRRGTSATASRSSCSTTSSASSTCTAGNGWGASSRAPPRCSSPPRTTPTSPPRSTARSSSWT